MSDVTGGPQQPWSPPGAAPPGPMPPPPGVSRRTGKTRNPWGVWLLSLVSLGIYGIVWYYKVNKETHDYDPRIEVNPAMCVVTILFGWILCLIPPLVSIYNTGTRIAKAQEAAGAPVTCQPIIGLLLAFVSSTHSVYYQSQINKVWDVYGNPPEGTSV
jgi:hypothetical protein